MQELSLSIKTAVSFKGVVFCAGLEVHKDGFVDRYLAQSRGEAGTKTWDILGPGNCWPNVTFSFHFPCFETSQLGVLLKMVSTPKNPMVLLIIIPMKNCYFIGNIHEYTLFSDKPNYCSGPEPTHCMALWCWPRATTTSQAF